MVKFINFIYAVHCKYKYKYMDKNIQFCTIKK